MADILENYISVDVETAGPTPETYSMLSIGACTVFEPQSTFYVELQPVNENKILEALMVAGLNWDHLKENGIPPRKAMAQFAQWVDEIATEESPPIFLAFNAPFDWLFVNEYFYRFLGHNPFGHKALDIKSYYMGLHGVPWEETGMRFVSEHYLDNQNLTHHALRDALDQAEIFRRMVAKAKTKHKGETE
jgi:DNA polymerase III epsilon subunit-like protein